jgi:tRNA(Ile)-lysidine synthase
MPSLPALSLAEKSVPGSLLRRVRRQITRQRLLPPGSRVLVAVSGGQDSLALAEILRALQHPAALRWPAFALAHTDHCWPADAGCAHHVAAYAQRVSLPLHVAAPAIGICIPRSEAAARDWRYAALAAIAQKHEYTHVAVGHTRSDLAETLLFNLAHGAGANGLSSLTWQRDLAVGGRTGLNVVLSRPLLDVSRAETELLCQARGVAVWNDVYNLDNRYARYHTRNHVLPYLRAHYNPSVEDALARTAHLLRDDAAALDARASAVFDNAVVDIGRMDTATIQIEPIAVQRRVIRRMLLENTKTTGKSAVFKQIDALVGLLGAADGTALPSLPGGASAHVRGPCIVIRDVADESRGDCEPKECDISPDLHESECHSVEYRMLVTDRDYAEFLEDKKQPEYNQQGNLEKRTYSQTSKMHSKV